MDLFFINSRIASAVAHSRLSTVLNWPPCKFLLGLSIFLTNRRASLRRSVIKSTFAVIQFLEFSSTWVCYCWLKSVVKVWYCVQKPEPIQSEHTWLSKVLSAIERDRILPAVKVSQRVGVPALKLTNSMIRSYSAFVRVVSGMKGMVSISIVPLYLLMNLFISRSAKSCSASVKSLEV